MEKKPIEIMIIGGLSAFVGVLLLINLLLQWQNLIAQYTFVIAIVYMVFGGGLAVGGSGVIMLKNWARLLLMGLYGLFLFCLVLNVASSIFIPGAITSLNILILLIPLTMCVVPLIYLTRPWVKEHFGVVESQSY